MNIEKPNPRVKSGGLFTVELEAQILRLVWKNVWMERMKEECVHLLQQLLCRCLQAGTSSLPFAVKHIFILLMQSSSA